MQPTEEQVERTLEDLRRQPPPASGHGPRADQHDVPPEVDAVLSGLPLVREELVARARERLASGTQPSSEELARRVVGRLVCDRVR